MLHKGHILGASAFLILPIAILAPKGVAPLFVLAAAAILVLRIIRKDATYQGIFGVGVILALFAGLAWVSALWSFTPGESLKTSFSLTLTFFGGLLLAAAGLRLDKSERRFFDHALMIGGVLGFLLLGEEILSGNAVFRALQAALGKPQNPWQNLLPVLNQAAVVASLYLWPLAVTLYRKKGTAIAIGVVISMLVVLTFADAFSHKAALVLGLAVMVAGLLRMRAVAVLLGATVALGVLTTPWIVSQLPDPLKQGNAAASLSHSLQHRIVIWKTANGLIGKKPLLGYGMDTSRAFYGENQKVLYRFPGNETNASWLNRFEPIPLHPHNGVLQIWLEFGALGAVVFLAFLMAVIRAIAGFGGRRLERGAALGAVVTALTIFSISFGAWQSWWLATLFFTGAFMVAALPEPDSTP